MDDRVQSFEASGDVVEGDGLRSEVVAVGGFAVARNTHQPGWRWSVNVGEPGTHCGTRHVGYAISGRLALELRTGERFEIAGGSAFDIPEGHDGWVVGDEPFVTVEWLGARTWMRGAGGSAERILVTLVMTDIVGSTDLAQRLGGSGWADLIGAYEHQMTEVLAASGGALVKFTGDGVLGYYDSAARGLRGAQALRDAAWGLGLRTRTAVHAGEVTVADNDLHGIAVHEAARVLALAEADEVLVTAALPVLVADAGFRFADRGEHELKGLTGARKVHALEQ